MRPAPILVVSPADDEWGLHRYVLQAAREVGHALGERLEGMIDSRLELSFEPRLVEAGAVILFAQDPLGPLYPGVYRWAQELERLCDAAGVPLVNRPDALSRTCKSTQLLLLRRAGIDVARAAARA